MLKCYDYEKEGKQFDRALNSDLLGCRKNSQTVEYVIKINEVFAWIFKRDRMERLY